MIMQKLILSCLVVAVQCRHRIQDKYNSVSEMTRNFNMSIGPQEEDSMSVSPGHLIRDGELRKYGKA